jgi:hypothetical protein
MRKIPRLASSGAWQLGMCQLVRSSVRVLQSTDALKFAGLVM